VKNKKILVTVTAALLLSPLSSSAKYDENEKRIKGSITTRGSLQADFPKLAKISAREAVRIAKEKMPGTVHSVSLEEEDGYLVYSVEIISKESTQHELLVDAGNGGVLSTTLEFFDAAH